jgi:phosphoglycolate phosphatase
VELLAYLLESERLVPGSALMIGDRKHDLIGARSNGLQAVAVGYGFGRREELLGEAPDFHFETLEDMRRAFLPGV